MSVVSTPIGVFNCPSRRAPQTIPLNARHEFLANNLRLCTHADQCLLAKIEYAANSGSRFPGDQPGPANKQLAPNYSWFSVHDPADE